MSSVNRYDYGYDPQGQAWAARLLRQVRPGDAVLELGPGPGAMTKVLVERGHTVTVIENDPQALAMLQERSSSGELTEPERVMLGDLLVQAGKLDEAEKVLFDKESSR